jgi:acyl-CoA synthetase (AMP-forming)/AMP-acid ligase II
LAVFEDRVTTYVEMERWAMRIASGLSDRGLMFGDVVALLSYNSTDFLATIFAANWLGAVAMPINWRLASAEIRYLLENSGARALVCDEALVDLANDATTAFDSSLLRICMSPRSMDSWVRFADVEGESPVPRAAVKGDDVHRLMYTSGTTGRPKGVMITYANLAWKNYAHITEFGYTSSDVGLACGPLYHVGALDLVATTMIAIGAQTIIHRTFDPSRVAEEIERSKVSTVWMAPAMIRAVLDEPGVEEHDLSSVRVIIAGGEKLPIPFINRIQRTFRSAWLADAYGLTETVSGDTFLDRQSTKSKLGSVGRACLYLDLEIWDERGKAVPPGERGEVVLRGPKVFKGYWRDPTATSNAFAGGWFHTGDVGIKDEDGYVYIVDRLKDMIITGGENVAGSEVERILYEHPAVVEVAVVGRPDERWGEVPVAYVVLRPESGATSDELIEHCRQQLAKFKVPKDVTFVRALPRNPSGKVLKRELRNLFP